MIDYPEDVEHSIDYLKKALPKMAQYKLAANPVNYSLWYTYVTARLPDLNRSVEQLVHTEGAYTPGAALALFQHYILQQPGGDVRRAAVKLQLMAESVSQQTNDVVQRTEQLDRSMAESCTALHAAQQHADAKQLVDTAVAAIEQARRANRSALNQLRQSGRELDAVKGELQRSQQAADIDPVTRLYNRTACDRELRQRLAGIEPHQQLSIIFCDIDHFKRFNDQFGHLMGDRVLQRVGALILELTRTSSFAARFGGEEFLIIVPNATPDEARAVAERLRLRIEQLRVKVRNTDQVLDNITASFGVATYQRGDTLETLFDRADQALYAAKAAGRNVVLAYDNPEQTTGKMPTG